MILISLDTLILDWTVSFFKYRLLCGHYYLLAIVICMKNEKNIRRHEVAWGRSVFSNI